MYREQLPDEEPPTVRWLPFQLNPDLPEAGISRKEYVERKIALGFPDDRELDLPAWLLEWPSGAGQVSKESSAAADPNPIRVSLRIAENAVGQKQTKELQARHSRHLNIKENKIGF